MMTLLNVIILNLALLLSHWTLQVTAVEGNCYSDQPRLLPDYKGSSSDMTPAVCQDRCKLKYAYSGVQYYNECWCGNDAPPKNKKLNMEKCDTMCKGDKNQRCGGGYKINIIKDPKSKEEYVNEIKKAYLALKDGPPKKYNHEATVTEYSKSVREMLPLLLNVDAIDQKEVGVAFAVTDPKEPYPLALLTGEGIITERLPMQSISINGTVTKYVGKRRYSDARYRPTGLYAKPGDIITITIPSELVGKINAKIGHDNHFYNSGSNYEWPLKKLTQKIASPWGGLILIVLKDIDATTKLGQFNVEIQNAFQAPTFAYGEDTNADWNKIKNNAAPWAVLRIPGRWQIYIQTKHVKIETDMEKIMKGWKETMDILDELIGIPLDIQPGEEQLHYDPYIGGGLRWGTCGGGGKSGVGDYWEEFASSNAPVVFHEQGHGYCYHDLPGMGGQWTAEIVREYVERAKGFPMVSRESKLDQPFNVLYRMVSFSKFSNGKACGTASFPDSSKTSYSVSSYDNCYTYLYRLPLFEFGWSILKDVLSTDATSTKSYSSKTDRMADLYCTATKSNLIPLFNFYNIKVSESIAKPCKKQKMPVLITKYIEIANCIKNEDIMKCTKIPGFPEHKGICTFDGTCSISPDYKDTMLMNNEFDLWGGTADKVYKSGFKNTSQVEKNCLGRAKEMFGWCGNSVTEPITATFTTKDGISKSSFPPEGNCYYDWPRLLPNYKESSSDMTPAVCKEKCKEEYAYSGVQNYDECWCGKDAPPLGKKLNMEKCDRMCKGDKKQRCGGGYKMNIIKV